MIIDYERLEEEIKKVEETLGSCDEEEKLLVMKLVKDRILAEQHRRKASG